jgi:hypothetical protein
MHIISFAAIAWCSLCPSEVASYIRVGTEKRDVTVIIPCRPETVDLNGDSTTTLTSVPFGKNGLILQGFFSLKADKNELAEITNDVVQASPDSFSISLRNEEKELWARASAGGTISKIPFSFEANRDALKQYGLNAVVSIEWQETKHIHHTKLRFHWAAIHAAINQEIQKAGGEIDGENLKLVIASMFDKKFVEVLSDSSVDTESLHLASIPNIASRTGLRQKKIEGSKGKIETPATSNAESKEVPINLAIKFVASNNVSITTDVETVELDQTIVVRRQAVKKFENVFKSLEF